MTKCSSWTYLQRPRRVSLFDIDARSSLQFWKELPMVRTFMLGALASAIFFLWSAPAGRAEAAAVHQSGVGARAASFRPDVGDRGAADRARLRDQLPKLRAAIDSGIALLEAQQWKPFLERFIVPAQKEAVMRIGGIDELVKEFTDEKAMVLLNALKDVRLRTPKFNEAKSTATLRLTKRLGGHATIVFQLVDGAWYIVD